MSGAPIPPPGAPALSPIALISHGLPGLVGVLDRARGLLGEASSLKELRTAQTCIDLAIFVAKALYGRQSPLDTPDQFQSVRLMMAEALTLEHQALCDLARAVNKAQANGDLAKSGQRTDLVDDVYEVPPTLSQVGLARDKVQAARQRLIAETATPGQFAATAHDIARDSLPSRAEIRRRMSVLDSPDILPPTRRKRRAPAEPVGAIEIHRRKLLGAATALTRALDNARSPAALRALDAAQVTDLLTLSDRLRAALRPSVAGGTDHDAAAQTDPDKQKLEDVA